MRWEKGDGPQARSPQARSPQARALPPAWAGARNCRVGGQVKISANTDGRRRAREFRQLRALSQRKSDWPIHYSA